MSLYLVDTNSIIDALHGEPVAIQTLADLTDDGLALSLITYAELFEGAYFARDSQTALAGIRTFLKEKELLLLTTAIAERFAIVRGHLSRHLRRQIGDLDLLIAATALEHDLILHTRNVKDFQHIPGLRFFVSSNSPSQNS
jgi:tRNA(fMet)-specific endonuclease VapC